MNSARRTAALPAVGFPIRRSPDQSLVSGSSRSRVRKRTSTKTKVQPGRKHAVVNRRVLPSHVLQKMPVLLFLRVCSFQRSQIDRKSRRGGADRDRTDDIQLAKLAL